MKLIFQSSRSRQSEQGLTLLEMFVATSLLVVMMLGLTAMFNQTQRAFRSGLKQVDVFEGGRAVMDMIARDIEQLAATKSVDNWSLYSGLQAVTRLEQPLPTDERPAGFVNRRTNVLHAAYLLNFTTRWTALGYRVLDPNDVDNFNNLTFGSLYRFSTNFADLPNQTNFYFNIYSDLPSEQTNGYITRVADGIVHFRLNFYDATGTLIPSFDGAGNVTNVLPSSVMIGSEISPTILPGERQIGFSDGALPSMVEVELGIIEPQTLKEAQSLPAGSQTEFLQQRAGKIHIFRQQIPIRNAPR